MEIVKFTVNLSFIRRRTGDFMQIRGKIIGILLAYINL
jgi:hypothetical protein